MRAARRESVLCGAPQVEEAEVKEFSKYSPGLLPFWHFDCGVGQVHDCTRARLLSVFLRSLLCLRPVLLLPLSPLLACLLLSRTHTHTQDVALISWLSILYIYTRAHTHTYTHTHTG